MLSARAMEPAERIAVAMSRRWAGLDQLRNDYRPRYCKSSLQDPIHQGIEQNIKDLVGDFLGDNNQTNITMVASPPMHSSTPMSTNSREAVQSKQQLVASASLDKLVKTPSKVAVSKSVQIIKTSCSPAVFRDKTVKKRVLGLEIGRTTTFLDEEDVGMVNDSPTLFIKEAGKRNVSEPEKVAKPTDLLYAGDTSAVLEPSSPSVKLQARKRLSFKEKTFPMNKTLAVEVTKQNPPQDITKPMSPVEKTVLLNRTTVPSMVHTASKQNAENGGNVRNEETPIGLRKSHANEVEMLEKTQECTGVQPTLLDNEKQSKSCNLHLKETANQTFKSIFLGATQPENRFSVFSQPPPPAPSLSSEKDSDDEFIIDDADTFTFKSWSRSFKKNKPSAKNQTAAAVAKTQLEKLSKTDVTQEYKVISSQTDINNENLYTSTTVNILQLSDRNKKVGVIKDQVSKNVSHADKTSKLCTPMAVESHQEQNKTVLVKDQSRHTLSQTYATTDIQSTSVMKARVPRKRNTVFMDEDLATEVTTDNRTIAVKKKKTSRKKKGGKQKWSKTVRNKTKCLSVVAVEKGLLKVQMNPDIASGNETRRSLAQTDTSKNKPKDTTLSKRDVAERIPSRTQDDITMTKENVKIPCGKMLKSNIVNTMPEIAKDEISSTDDATRHTSAGTKVHHLVKSPLKKQDKIKEGKRKKKENISRKPKKKVGCQDNSNERDSASNVGLAENCMLSRSKNSWRQSAVHRRQSVVAANDVCSSEVVDPSVSEIVQCSPMEYRSKKRNIDDVMENNEVKPKPVKSILKTTTHKCKLPISDKGPDMDLEVEEDENLQTDVFAVPQKLASRVSALRKSLLPTRQHQRLSSFMGSLESFGAAYAKSPLENKTQPHKLDLEVNDAYVSPIKVPGHTLKVAGPQTAILSVSSPHHVYSGSVNKVGGQIENMDFFTDDAEVLEEELEPTKHGKKDKYSTQKEYLCRLSSEGHTMKVNRPRKNIPPFSSQSDVSSGAENEDGSSTENMENISRKVEEGLKERHKPNTHGKVKFSSQKESLSSFPSVEDTLLNIASGAASSESCSKKHKLDDTFELAGENIQPSALPYAHGSGSILKSGSGKITSRIRITSERDDLIPFQLHESDSDCDSKYIDCNPNPQIHVTKKQKKIVLPSHTPNMRRSKRTRVQPLEYWRGERVDYRPRPSGGFVVDGVLSPNIDEKMYKKAKTKRKHPEQRETKDYKWVKDENGATVTEPTLVLDSVQGKEKYLECVKTEEECVFQSSDDLIGVCRSISQPTFSVGKLILGPLQEKGFQFVCQNTLIFYVVDGVVLTTVHCTSYRLKTGDYFFIPPNNMYNIKNLRENSSSVILFVQLKEIKQDLKTPDEE